jgi:hypothetical protein
MKTNTMLDCGHPESEHSSITRGYGKDSEGKTFCYDCCAKMDLEFMQSRGKIALYLVNHDNKYFVTNWPGSLSFPIRGKVIKGHHNIAGTRYDVWFYVPNDKYLWHGIQYGDNTQICHCKRTKKLR